MLLILKNKLYFIKKNLFLLMLIILLPSIYASSVEQRFYKFNSTELTRPIDSSINNVKGSLYNVDYIIGKIGNGIRINDYTDTFNFNATGNLSDLNNNDLTIAYWINITDVPSTSWYSMRIGTEGTGTFWSYMMQLGTSGGNIGLYGQIYNGVSSTYTTFCSLGANYTKWHHIVFTFESGTGGITNNLKIYNNGKLCGTGTYTGGAATNPVVGEAFITGGYAPATRKCWASYDDFRVYKYTLTTNDILFLYNSGNGTTKTLAENPAPVINKVSPKIGSTQISTTPAFVVNYTLKNNTIVKIFVNNTRRCTFERTAGTYVDVCTNNSGLTYSTKYGWNVTFNMSGSITKYNYTFNTLVYDTALNTKLLAYWSFDNTNADSSSYSHGLVGYNSIAQNLTDYKVGIGSGQFKRASSQYYAIGNFSTLKTTQYNTVALWVKKNAEEAGDYFILGAPWSTDGFMCDLWNNGERIGCYYYKVGGGACSLYIDNANIDDGNWHHYVFVNDMVANTRVAYVDGSPHAIAGVACGGGSSILYNTGHPMYVGRDQGTNYYNKFMDELAIWNRTLSASEVTTLYNSGSGYNPTAGESNVPPQIVNPLPAYNTSFRKDSLKLNATIIDRNLDNMTVRFYVNNSLICTIKSVYNGSYVECPNTNLSTAIDYGKTYRWNITVTDGFTTTKYNSTFNVYTAVPVINYFTPKDKAINISVHPVININYTLFATSIVKLYLNNVKYCQWENTSGTYNNYCPNITGLNTNTLYKWNITMNDSITFANFNYTFTTYTTNTGPIISNALPIDTATGIDFRNIKINATITDQNLDNITVRFYIDDNLKCTVRNVYNNTLATCPYTNLSLSKNITYIYKISADDGLFIRNYTASFTTLYVDEGYVILAKPNNNFEVSLTAPLTINYTIDQKSTIKFYLNNTLRCTITRNKGNYIDYCTNYTLYNNMRYNWNITMNTTDGIFNKTNYMFITVGNRLLSQIRHYNLNESTYPLKDLGSDNAQAPTYNASNSATFGEPGKLNNSMRTTLGQGMRLNFTGEYSTINTYDNLTINFWYKINSDTLGNNLGAQFLSFGKHYTADQFALACDLQQNTSETFLSVTCYMSSCEGGCGAGELTQLYSGNVYNECFGKWCMVTYNRYHVTGTTFMNEFWINNVKRRNNSASLPYKTIGNTTAIGTNYIGTLAYVFRDVNHNFDTIRIYKSYMTQTDINYLYNNGAGTQSIYTSSINSPPVITNVLPVSETNFKSGINNVKLNATITDINLDFMTVKFYLNDILKCTYRNVTNGTFLNCDNATSLTVGTYYWNITANDSYAITNNKYNFTINTTSKIYSFNYYYPNNTINVIPWQGKLNVSVNGTNLTSVEVKFSLNDKLICTNITTTKVAGCVLPKLNFSEQYYWNVSINNSKVSNVSGIYFFNTTKAILSTTTVYPANLSTDIDIRKTNLSFILLTNNPNATTVKFYINSSLKCTTTAYNNTKANCSLVPELKYNTTYVWKYTLNMSPTYNIYNASGNYTFTTKEVMTPKLTIYSPQNTTYYTFNTYYNLTINFTANSFTKLWFKNITTGDEIVYTTEQVRRIIPGNYKYEFYANNSDGIVNNTNVSFKVLNVSLIKITIGAPNNTIYKSSVSGINIRVNTSAGVTNCNYSLTGIAGGFLNYNSGYWTVTTDNINKLGQQNLTVSCYNSGNPLGYQWNVTNTTFILKETVIKPNITFPINNRYYNESRLTNLTGEVLNAQIIYCQNYSVTGGSTPVSVKYNTTPQTGITIVNCDLGATETRNAPPDFIDGNIYKIIVKNFNGYNNTNETEILFYYDNTKPSTTITAPLPGNYDNEIEFQFTYTDVNAQGINRVWYTDTLGKNKEICSSPGICGTGLGGTNVNEGFIPYPTGTHTLYTYVTDFYNNTNMSSRTFTIDTLTLSGGDANGTTYNSLAPAPVFGFTTSANGFCKIYLNSTLIETKVITAGAVTFTELTVIPNLIQGRNNISVICNNTYGTNVTFNYWIMYATQLPHLSSILPLNNVTYTTSTITVTLNYSSPFAFVITDYTIEKVGGTGLPNCEETLLGSYTIPFVFNPSLTPGYNCDGTYRLYMSARDVYDNTNETTYPGSPLLTFYINAYAIIYSVDLPLNTTYNNTVPSKVLINESYTNAWYTINNAITKYALINNTIATRYYPAGKYTNQYYVNDTSGVISNTNVSFTVNLTSPIILNYGNETYTNNSLLNVSFRMESINSPITCRLTVNNTIVKSVVVLNNVTSNLSYILTSGGYYYNVSCRDLYQDYVYTNTSYYYYDTTPPRIFDIQQFQNDTLPVIGTLMQLNVSVTDNINISSCRLLINRGSGYELKQTKSSINAKTTTIAFNYTVQAPTAWGFFNYTWKVNCSDIFNNKNESIVTIFTVKDLTPPVIILGPGNSFSTNNNTVITPTVNNKITSSYCYQEFANVSTSCGGLSTGKYVKSGVWTIDTSTLYDGNYNTYDGVTAGNTAYLHINYTKPKNSYGGIWKVKYERLTTTVTNNVTIPQSCWNYNASRLELLLESSCPGGGVCVDSVYGYCKNSTGWQKIINSYATGAVIYEEAMYWTVFGSGTIPSTNGTIRLNITYTDASIINITIRVNCTINKTIYYYSNNGSILHIETVINFTDYPPQKCEWYTTATDGINLVTQRNFFYLGARLYVRTRDLARGEIPFNNFNVTIRNITAPVYGITYHNISSNFETFIYNLTRGTYNISFVDNNKQKLNKSYILSITNSTHYKIYNTSEAEIVYRIRSVKDTGYLSGFNVTLTNHTFTIFNDASSTEYNLTFYLNKTLEYNVTIKKSKYSDYETNLTTNYMDYRILDYVLNFYASFRLYDENTFGTFNVSSANKIRLVLYCQNVTLYSNVTSINFTFLVTCNYNKFGFDVEYYVPATGGGTTLRTYFRNLIYTPEESQNATVYLLNLLTTTDVYNTFYLDDLTSRYINPKLIISTITPNGTVQITGDEITMERTVPAYLMLNRQYRFILRSDNFPDILLGIYIASTEGRKNIQLYDINYNLNSPSKQTFTAYTTVVNQSGTMNAISTYIDPTNTTTDLILVIKDSNNNILSQTNLGQISSAQIITNLSNLLYENKTVYATWQATQNNVKYNYTNVVQTYRLIQNIANDIKSFVNEKTIYWIVTIFISIFALMATVTSANIMGIVIVLVAVMFQIFGFYFYYGLAIVLALIIAIISLLKQKDKE
jgi:hypothetical protein